MHFPGSVIIRHKNSSFFPWQTMNPRFWNISKWHFQSIHNVTIFPPFRSFSLHMNIENDESTVKLCESSLRVKSWIFVQYVLQFIVFEAFWSSRPFVVVDIKITTFKALKPKMTSEIWRSNVTLSIEKCLMGFVSKFLQIKKKGNEYQNSSYER